MIENGLGGVGPSWRLADTISHSYSAASTWEYIGSVTLNDDEQEIMVLTAWTSGRPLGIAICGSSATSEKTAELAITDVDDWSSASSTSAQALCARFVSYSAGGTFAIWAKNKSSSGSGSFKVYTRALN